MTDLNECLGGCNEEELCEVCAALEEEWVDAGMKSGSEVVRMSDGACGTVVALTGEKALVLFSGGEGEWVLKADLESAEDVAWELEEGGFDNFVITPDPKDVF